MKRNPTLKATIMLTTLITVVSLTGCLNSDNDNSAPMGGLTIAVTDSPIDDASAVWIQFVGVTLHDIDGYETEVIFDEPKLIDLLSLQGSNSEKILIEHSVQSGNYSFVTFNIDFNASSIVINATSYSLEPAYPDGYWKSLYQNLILSNSVELPIRPFTITENITTHLTFDFDLRKSIYDAGISNIYSFFPAIRSVTTDEAGSIAGNIDSGIYFNTTNCIAENSAIYIFSGNGQSLRDTRGTSGDPFSTSNITNTNTYELGFLPAGDYTVAIACNSSEDTVDNTEIMLFKGKQNISVSIGETANGDFL
ncbi:MAG: DUF4382 domain-containing protein [Pseudomonadales bacterium]|nr:DUF4382 domain-containing protein [Pseudomonadales bacterium]